MNKHVLFLVVVLCHLCSTTTLQAQTARFRHPGILHTQADFDRIRQKLSEADPQVTAAYEVLTSNWLCNKWGSQWGPNEYIKRGISGDENYMNAARDAAMAYQFALRYKISGETIFADRVVEILNPYARVTKGITGNTNMSLVSGMTGYQLANAAELIRDYEGWARADFSTFCQWMVDVFFTTAQDFLQRRHDTCGAHYHSNWGASNILTVLSIGILCDDPAIYNFGMYELKQGGGNETLNTDYCGSGAGLIPFFFEDERGPFGALNQMQESGRDQPHCMLGLSMTAMNCQVAWNQGDNVFCNVGDNMLAGAIEYVAL